jgi:ankyrin repeat protein
MHPDDDSPQTDLVHEAFSSDPDEGIALIDDALARGADFTSGGIQPLHDAASNRQPRILQHLINRGATLAGEWPNNASRYAGGLFGDTALHAAAANGDCECLRILLAADGRAFIDTFDECGWTPLICAIRAGQAAAVQLLLKHGADVNIREERLISNPAIREAVEAGHIGIVQLLLSRGADPTLPGWMMLTAIHKAQLGVPKTAAILELFKNHLALPKDRWQELLLRDKQKPRKPRKTARDRGQPRRNERGRSN